MRSAFLVLACLLASTLAGCADEPSPASKPSSKTVTISRAEFDALKAAVADLQAQLSQLKGQPPVPGTTPAGPPTDLAPSAPTGEEGTTTAPAAPPTELGATSSTSEETPTNHEGGRYLSLPDISLVVQSLGKVSSDKRDEQRNRLRLTEAELAIQGYVYPEVKADCFITMSPAEGEDANVEEAYLSYLALAKGLTAQVGRKHVPFGRTNLVHNHSWLYTHQPLVLRNLVAEESLTGDGINFSYLLPTPPNYFAQLDLGTWTGDGAGEVTELPDLMVGPGASFADRFYTARLWASHALRENTELELGGSYANGSASGLALEGDGDARLTGVDLSYRHFGEGTSRTLLRGEMVWRREEVGTTSDRAKGYYLFANRRPDKYSSWGVLYDWSEFPQAPNLHESAASLIYTKQFSEQYYMRLQGTHGSRPGDSSYNELALQWVWGIGPHTHNLE
jgi:hypothetical protein